LPLLGNVRLKDIGTTLDNNSKKIARNNSEGIADSRVQSAGSHSKPDEYGIFCKKLLKVGIIIIR